jgi:precorrin-6A/cobalt-precorrin-6A reductase
MRPAGSLERRVLLLGGTLEARLLAERLQAQGVGVVTSLAGATASPARIPGEIRRGGFGGTAGLVACLRAGDFAALIDATHPFARTMQERAIEAARSCGVPLLRLERPGWAAQPGDRWILAADLAQAIELLPGLGRRVFVALGRRLAADLPDCAGMTWLVRSIEPPERLPANARWLPGRGPFTAEEERALFARESIEAILAKASGGEGAVAKLDAARCLGLPVVLLARPRPGARAGDVAGSVEEAVRWSFAVLARGP